MEEPTKMTSLMDQFIIYENKNERNVIFE